MCQGFVSRLGTRSEMPLLSGCVNWLSLRQLILRIVLQNQTENTLRHLIMKQYFLLSISFILGFSVLHAQEPTALPDYQPDALYLKFKAGSLDLPTGDSRHVPVSALFPTADKGDFRKYGLRAEAFCLRSGNNPALQYAFKLRFDSVQNAGLLLRQLQQDPRIELVERVPLYRASACPSDE